MNLIDWSAVQHQPNSGIFLFNKETSDEALRVPSPTDEANTVQLSDEVPSKAFVVLKPSVPMGTNRVLHGCKLFGWQNNMLIRRVEEAAGSFSDKFGRGTKSPLSTRSLSAS
jgi:hypothetical protein